MTIQNNIKLCVDILRSDFETEIKFDDAISVKKTPHQELFRCWGASATGDGKLMLMDAEEKWHEVHPSQVNVEYVVASVLQRLKLLTAA